MKKLVSTLIILAAFASSYAQNMVDAIRLSDVRLQGTARSTAMGNAFGALGGDFTSSSINPAGIGVYRSSEFVFTTQLGNEEVDANYLGTTNTDNKFKLSVPNIGYVVTFPSSPNGTGSLVSFSLGLGYNRMNNFNVNKIVDGTGATSSMLDQFVVNADNGNISDLYEDLAVNTDLIYYYDDDPSQTYYHDILKYQQADPDNLENFPHSQRKSFSQRGSLDEYTIAAAVNFNHKVYLGATLGIHDVYFKETTSLTEYGVNYGSNNFDVELNEYGFDTYLKTTGTGINLKLGAIFKPVDELRLGIALHTPTFYDLHDSFDTYMYSDLAYAGEGNEFKEAWSPYYDYDYRLETPLKAIFSAAYVVGKAGLISVDYEYIDYSNMRLRDGGDGWSFGTENQEIKEAFKGVGNLHLGAEYRLTNFFSLRGGYEYLPSPYAKNAFGFSQPNANENTQTYAAGFGIKSGGIFFDLAYKHIENTNHLELYQVPQGVDSPMASFNHQNNYVSFTLGFKF